MKYFNFFYLRCLISKHVQIVINSVLILCIWNSKDGCFSAGIVSFTQPTPQELSSEGSVHIKNQEVQWVTTVKNKSFWNCGADFSAHAW